MQTLRWRIGVAFFALLVIGLNDGAFGVILPSLRKYYQIDKGTVGLLFLAATAGYFLAAFNSGWLVEKLGTRRFLIVGATIFGAGFTGYSLVPPFGLLIGCSLLLGMGIAVLDAGLNAYIARLPRSTTTLNNLHAFYGLGALIGPVVVVFLLSLNWNWNNIYLLWLGLVVVLVAGLTLTFAGEDAVPTGAGGAAGAGEPSDSLMMLTFKLRVVWMAAFFLMFYVGAEVSLGSWGYSLLTEDRGENALLAGWMISGYWIGLTLGRVLLAKLAERAGVGNKGLIQGCLAGTATGVLILWLVPLTPVTAFALVLIGFSLGPIFPTTIALMPSLVPARAISSSIGFLTSLGSAGAAFFPWMAGNLAENIGLWTILPYVIALTVVMLGLWLALQAAPRSKQAAFDSPPTSSGAPVDA